MTMHWTIKDVAQTAGTTSRTLRHYDQIGLLKPSAIGENGYRLYDASALVRLQRILALRDLGLGLPQIKSILEQDLTEIEALTNLEQQLVQESRRLERQISTVQRTIHAIRKGESPMSTDMFDGFRHEQYKEEVEERWGKDAYARSDAWWNNKSDEEKLAWQQKLESLNRDWQAAHSAGESPGGDVAQALAERHIAWLRDLPNEMLPGDFRAYVLGLAEMYVSDPRFAANYGGELGATFVRDALRVYFQANE